MEFSRGRTRGVLQPVGTDLLFAEQQHFGRPRSFSHSPGAGTIDGEASTFQNSTTLSRAREVHSWFESEDAILHLSQTSLVLRSGMLVGMSVWPQFPICPGSTKRPMTWPICCDSRSNWPSRSPKSGSSFACTPAKKSAPKVTTQANRLYKCS